MTRVLQYTIRLMRLWTPRLLGLFHGVLVVCACEGGTRQEVGFSVQRTELTAALTVQTEVVLPTQEALCQSACTRALECGKDKLGASASLTGASEVVAACVTDCSSHVPATYGEKKAFAQATTCVSKASCAEFEACWTEVVAERRAALR